MRSIRNRSGSGTNEDNVDRLEQENDRAWRILVAKKNAEINAIKKQGTKALTKIKKNCRQNLYSLMK